MKLSESQKDILYAVAGQALTSLVHSKQTETEAFHNAAKRLIDHQGMITSLMKKGVLDGQCDITELGIEEAKKVYGNTTHRGTVEREEFDDAVQRGREEQKRLEDARKARENEWNEFLASLPELPGYELPRGYPGHVQWKSVEFARIPDLKLEDKNHPHGSEDRYREAEWVFSGGGVSWMDTEALGDYINSLTTVKGILESLIEKYKDAPVKSLV